MFYWFIGRFLGYAWGGVPRNSALWTPNSALWTPNSALSGAGFWGIFSLKICLFRLFLGNRHLVPQSASRAQAWDHLYIGSTDQDISGDCRVKKWNPSIFIDTHTQTSKA